MAKKRVVTAQKTMRFKTTFGTETSRDVQQHAEEREAKRWFQTRLDKYAVLAAKYDRQRYDEILSVMSGIRTFDMMKMTVDHVYTWQFAFDGQPLVLAVKRLA